jgi:hypothetical protein
MQISLMNIPARSDVVYTPDTVARAIVEFYRPRGRILEPAAGDGAFLRHMPGALWCELTTGRDFFAWDEHVDWIVSNPPYSVFADWLRHSFDVADNIVYLIPVNKPFNSYKLMSDIYQWGGIRHCLVFGDGKQLGFPFGFATGAFHFQRAYCGGMSVTFAERNLTSGCSRRATRTANKGTLL